jgi:ATP-dependent Lhr-like helicase
VTALVRARLEIAGPTSAAALAASLPCEAREVEQALLALEQAGIALRGHFSAEFEASTQWCERRLLARIHRYTLNRLRQDIEAVPAAAYSRFLLDWQCVTPGRARRRQRRSARGAQSNVRFRSAGRGLGE